MYRDFIYMDSERVQSIIAQLNEGLLTEIIAERTKEITGKLGAAANVIANLLSFNLEGTAGYTSNNQSSKVLHDYAFNVALDTLEKKKLILTEEDLARRGASIPNTTFILIHGAASIVDYNIAHNMLSNPSFQDMIPDTDTNQQSLNRQQRRAAGITTKPTNPTKELIKQISDFINDFMKDLLLIRVALSNGATFVGPISKQFLREETSSIIFKYGREAQEGWTMLAQISSTPTSGNKMGELQDFVNTLTTAQQNTSTVIDMLNPMVEFVYGLQEAVASVSYPSIAVTPIAVYRELIELK